MKKQTVNFLDYRIVNTGNSDGWVITKSYAYENLWECNLGNFSDLEVAKKWAVLNFMIARPDVFHASIVYRMQGMGGSYHDGYLLQNQIEKENIPMPEEIGISFDANCMITFNGENI